MPTQLESYVSESISRCVSLIVRRHSQPCFSTLVRILHARLLHLCTCEATVGEFCKQSKIKSTLSSLASPNVGSRGVGSEASDDRGVKTCWRGRKGGISRRWMILVADDVAQPRSPSWFQWFVLSGIATPRPCLVLVKNLTV